MIQEEIEGLLKSLNLKGIREKALSENLNNMIKNKEVDFVANKYNFLRFFWFNQLKRETQKKAKNENEKSEKENKSGNSNIINENTSNSLQDSQVQDQDYWLKKVIEYETNSVLEETFKTDSVRTTRRKAQLTENKNQDTKNMKNIKNLELGSIKEMLLNIEENFSEYLKGWNSRWTKPKIKEEIVRYLQDLWINLILRKIKSLFAKRLRIWSNYY